FDLPKKFPGHAYLLHGYSHRKIVDEAVMVIGDAAGLAYAQSGEGIRPAVESGLMAAEAIAQADGNYSAERLNSYAHALAARYGNGQTVSAAKLLPAVLRDGLARLLLTSKAFCRGTVVENWFLHMRERALQTALQPVSSASHQSSWPA